VIGHVVKLTGSASIVRNGVTIDLQNGDVVHRATSYRPAAAQRSGWFSTTEQRST
jgi:hypothetical protein